MRSDARIVLLSVVVAVIGPACSSEQTASTAPSAPSPSMTVSAQTTPTTPSVEPSETIAGPTPSASPSPELEDGRHFGYIRSIDVESETLVFDLAYFLSGDEANQAAGEHGDETPVPNDYYIVNDNPRLRTLAVATDVEIRVIDWGHCCDLVQGEIQPFVEAFQTEHHAWNAMYQGGESQYWLTVEGGVVVQIEEQYLP